MGRKPAGYSATLEDRVEAIYDGNAGLSLMNRSRPCSVAL